MRDFSLLRLVFIAILGNSVMAPVMATSPGPRTYIYELIPDQNTLRYAVQRSEAWQVVYTGVEGFFQFEINGNGEIVSQKFDLTITGPIYDSLLEPVDWAPFAPGDALADYLAVDFADTTGLEVATIPFNGVENNGLTQAYVGPDVVGDSSMMSLGKNYYHINRLDIDPTYFFFEAQAREDLGGSFRIFPPDDASQPIYPPFTFPIPGEGNLPPYPIYSAVTMVAWLLPNVRLVPEPASIVLIGFVGAALGFRWRYNFKGR